MKVLIATEKPFSAAAVAQMRGVLEEAGHTVVLLEKYKSADELHAAVADVNALIVRSDIVDAAVIAAAHELKIIVRAGAGYDNIDLKAAAAAGIVVEQVFVIPGLGRMLVASISNRDYPVVQAIVVILAFWVVLAGTTADIINQRIDPRLRLGGAS